MSAKLERFNPEESRPLAVPAWMSWIDLDKHPHQRACDASHCSYNKPGRTNIYGVTMFVKHVCIIYKKHETKPDSCFRPEKEKK